MGVDNYFIMDTLLMIITFISIFCGVFTIYIIHAMKTWNGYVLLVYSLALCHVGYNMSYFMAYLDATVCPYKALIAATGTSVCMWITVMSGIIFYTTVYLVPFRVKDHFVTICAVVAIVSISIGAINGTVCYAMPTYYDIYWLYFGVRFISIVLNALLYIVVSVLLNLPYRSTWFNWTLSDFAVRRKTNALLVILVSRLRYYPLVQILTQVWSIWWDLEFGFDPYVTASFNDLSLPQKICNYLFAITSPWAGIGYFAIFLYIQPSAYHIFRVTMLRWMYGLVCRTPPPTILTTNANTASVDATELTRKSMDHYQSYRRRSSATNSGRIITIQNAARRSSRGSDVLSMTPSEDGNPFTPTISMVSTNTQSHSRTNSTISQVHSSVLTHPEQSLQQQRHVSGQYPRRLDSTATHNHDEIHFGDLYGDVQDYDAIQPIPDFILDDDLNEDLIFEEIDRRVSQHHSIIQMRDSRASNASVTNALHPL